jgi:F0F1-type ATP synthase assembly protein I
MNRRRLTHARRLTVVNAMLLFVILIVMLQLWLLTASVNAYLGGDISVTLPAALVSLICLGFNLGLLRYLYRFE